MKNTNLFRHRSSSFGVLIVAAILAPFPALAYTGPGAGLAAIGVLFGFIATIAIAAFGIIWYPAKRLIKTLIKRSNDKAPPTQAKDPEDS